MSRFILPGWVADVPQALNEAQFHEVWKAHVPVDSSAFDKALLGGYCADQPGWIFVAGYQGAIAHTFPEQHLQDWAAFAVSEDKSPDNPLPGLTCGDNKTLNGYKTWIATSRHTRDVLVSYRDQDQIRFSRFAVDCPGLTITHKTQPAMLPDVSQGVAHFEQVALEDGTGLDSHRVAQFGANEGFFVLIALLACLQRHSDEAALDDARLDDLLSQASELADDPAGHDETGSFKHHCRILLREVRDSRLGQDPLWQRDGKLLAAYAR